MTHPADHKLTEDHKGWKACSGHKVFEGKDADIRQSLSSCLSFIGVWPWASFFNFSGLKFLH